MEGSGERTLGEDTVILGCPLMNGIMPSITPFQDGLPCDWSKSNGANHLKSKNLCAQINLFSSEIDELGYFVTVTEP